jgi:hypothetical protein
MQIIQKETPPIPPRYYHTRPNLLAPFVSSPTAPTLCKEKKKRESRKKEEREHYTYMEPRNAGERKSVENQ